MWNNWEQLRCVAHLPLIIGMTIALLNLLGMCIIRTQCVRVYSACTKRLFSLLTKVIISVLYASPPVRCAIFSLNKKPFRFSWNVTKRFTFLKRHENQFKMLLYICVVQHAQTKSVFTYQPTEILASTTVKSAEPALTCLIIHLQNKNRQQLHLVEMVHIVLQERRIVTTKKKPSPFLKKLLRQSQTSTPEPVP